MNIAPDDASFIDNLKKLPLVSDAFLQSEAVALKQCQRLVTDIDRLDAEAAVRLPALRQEVTDSLAEVRKAEEKLKAIYNAHNAKITALASASFEYQRLRDGDENALSYSPAKDAIDEFRRNIWGLIERANKSLEYIEGKQTRLDGKAVNFVASNADQVQARVRALREAADAAHALRFVADQSDIEGKLIALLASLPKIEKLVAPPPAPNPANAAVDLPRFLPRLKDTE